MEYIAIFFTHSGAIKYHRYLKSVDIENETMTVPRKLSSNCGIGVKFFKYDGIENIIIDDIEKIYKLEDNQYILIYNCD
jgi:hypothetical protein